MTSEFRLGLGDVGPSTAVRISGGREVDVDMALRKKPQLVDLVGGPCVLLRSPVTAVTPGA